MKCITVWFNGFALLISKDYADLNSLKNGYKIRTQDEFWQILRGHAAHQIPKLEMLIAAKAKNLLSDFLEANLQVCNNCGNDYLRWKGGSDFCSEDCAEEYHQELISKQSLKCGELD